MRFPVHILLIFPTAFVVLLPALILGPGGNDLIYHTLWSREFARQFWQGDLYPHWLIDLNAGCGSPTFFFYPPLQYFITSFFMFTQHWGAEGWLPMACTAFIIITGAAFSLRHWLCLIGVSSREATYAGIAYLFMPYLWAVLYGMFAFAELSIFLWAPLVLSNVLMIARGSRRAIITGGLAYAAMILSHIPGTIVASTFLPLYLLFQPRGWRYIGQFALMIALGIGLAACYLLPIAAHYHDVYLSSVMWKGNGDYSRQFLLSANSQHNVATELLLIVFAIVIFSALTTASIVKNSHGEWRRQILFFFCAAGFATLLQFSISKFLWELFPVWQIVQFPSRFLSMQSLFFVMLIGCALAAWERKGLPKKKAEFFLIFLALFVPASLTQTLVHYSLNKEDKVISITDFPSLAKEVTRAGEHDAYIERMRKNYQYATLPTLEYIPQSVPMDYILTTPVQKLAAMCGDKAQFLSGKGEANVTAWGPEAFDVKVSASEPSAIRLGQFYFPGWQVHAENLQGVTLSAEEKTGLMLLHIPQAIPATVISLRLDYGDSWRYGLAISAISLLLTITGIICTRKNVNA